MEQLRPRPVLHQGEPSPGPVGAPGRAEEVGGFTVERMKNIFQTCHVVSCVKAMENPSQVLSGAQLHRILDAVVASTQAQTSTVAQPPVQPVTTTWLSTSRRQVAQFW